MEVKQAFYLHAFTPSISVRNEVDFFSPRGSFIETIGWLILTHPAHESIVSPGL